MHQLMVVTAPGGDHRVPGQQAHAAGPETGYLFHPVLIRAEQIDKFLPGQGLPHLLAEPQPVRCFSQKILQPPHGIVAGKKAVRRQKPEMLALPVGFARRKITQRRNHAVSLEIPSARPGRLSRDLEPAEPVLQLHHSEWRQRPGRHDARDCLRRQAGPDHEFIRIFRVADPQSAGKSQVLRMDQVFEACASSGQGAKKFLGDFAVQRTERTGSGIADLAQIGN